LGGRGGGGGREDRSRTGTAVSKLASIKDSDAEERNTVKKGSGRGGTRGGDPHVKKVCSGGGG